MIVRSLNSEAGTIS